MKTIGIIGGGQLGFMLIEYGIMKILKSCFLDLKILVLDENPECSCSSLINKYGIQIIVGSLMDSETINNFVAKCDIVTWEIEHFNTEFITQPEKIIPNVNILKTIQNKILQKQFFTSHDIPTAKYTFGKNNVDFVLSQKYHEVDVVSKQTNSVILSSKHLVIKQPLNGYDGRAVEVISGPSDVKGHTEILVEEFIDYKIELSVIVASDKKGELYTYECVAMDFHSKTNILDKCYVGLERLKEMFRQKCFSDKKALDIEKRAIELAKKVVKSFDLKLGLLAVEMFYCITTDTLLVNEVAPRVHNSGHHTIHSHNISQFEMVARMLLNINLAQPKMIHNYVMKNILGPQNISGPFYLENNMCVMPETSPIVVDYCKKITKPNRKIGHITFISDTFSNAKLQSLQSLHISVESGERNCKVGIVMGSNSDLTVMKEAAETLKSFGIQYEMTIVSAHRTPERLYKYANLATERGLKVIIAGAGGAAHLPGMLASITTVPIIGVPIQTSNLHGIDSLYSIVQMPPGVPVACMAIGGAKNAALFAVQILAQIDTNNILTAKLSEFRDKMKNTVYESALLKTY